MEGKLHTFGGRGLDRYLIDFEATVGGEGGGAAVPAEPVAPGEPVAPAAPAAAEPASPWAPSREEWDATQNFLGLLEQALAEPDPAQPEATPPALDFSNPQSVIDLIEQKSTEKAQELMEERLGPYVPMMDRLYADEGKALVNTELEKLATGDPANGVEGLGKFDLEMAGKLAQAYFHPGVNPHDVLRTAAQEVIAYEARVKQAALAAERGQIDNRLGAGTVPPPGAAAVEGGARPGEEGLDKYQLVAKRWEDRQRAASTSPIG